MLKVRRLLICLLLTALAACARVEPLPVPAAQMQAALAGGAAPPAARPIPTPWPVPVVAAQDGSRAADPLTERLLDFGEVFFPQYFPPGPATAAFGPWLYRYYEATGTYLGVSGGMVYVMGGSFGNSPLPVGPVADYVASTGTIADMRAATLPATLTAGDFVALRAVPLDAGGKGLADAPLQWTGTAAVARILRNRTAALTGAGTLALVATAGDRTQPLSGTVNQRDLGGRSAAIVMGPEETVFDADTQSCDLSDQPDVPAKAIRMPDGSVTLFAPNDPMNYVFAGADFEHLQRRCTPALRGADSWQPETFHNREWLVSPYREGGVIHALVHNEYHDASTPECMPGHSGADNPCWYNAITYTQSVDGGRSFSAPPSPSHVVAPPPQRWNGADPAMRQQPFGYFLPSNIVKRADGYYYALLMQITDPAHPTNRGLCTIRTQNLADPSSWRAWNGSDFNLPLANAYLQDSPAIACTLASSEAPGGMGGMHGSLIYSDFLGRYMLVSTSREWVHGQLTCGYFFALSSDLRTWSAPMFFAPAYLPANVADGACSSGNGSLGAATYASLIDHESASVNFETAGQVPYLYYTLWTDPINGTHRNLVRRPVIILKSEGFSGDVTPPTLALDLPTATVVLSGTTKVAGWAYDAGGLASVQVYVDSQLAGSATTGLPRPDVHAGIPSVPADVGYEYQLDTTRYSKGAHQVTVRATDKGGNVQTAVVVVTVAN